jgi:hypothetical protein
MFAGRFAPFNGGLSGRGCALVRRARKLTPKPRLRKQASKQRCAQYDWSRHGPQFVAVNVRVRISRRRLQPALDAVTVLGPLCLRPGYF